MTIVHEDGQVELEDIPCPTPGCGHNELTTHGVTVWTIIHCNVSNCECCYNVPTPADSEDA